MNLRPSLHTSAQCAALFALTVAAATVSAQAATPGSPQQLTMSLDQDLIQFFKWAVSLGAFFLLVFAGIGVLFFGWDVRKTRNAFFEAREDIAKRLAEVHQDLAALKKLKEDLEQLGGQLEEQAGKKGPTTVETPPAGETDDAGDADEPTAPEDDVETLVAHRIAIRKVIRSSKFNWTTIGTIQRKTGIPREAILKAVTSDSGIVISTGSGTKDLIFKLAEDYHKEIGVTAEQMKNLLEEHAARGREPVKGSIYS